MNIIFKKCIVQDLIQIHIYTLIMLGHFKKSAFILTDQETQMVGSDRWPATIGNTAPMNRNINPISVHI